MENMQNNMQNQNAPQQAQPLNKNLAMICGTIIVACLIIAGTLLYTNSKSNNNVVVNGNNQNQQQPQPQQPTGPQKVSIDDDPVLGNANATLTMIEFSDYQCPFCRSFMNDTLGQIKKDYIDTGKLKFVYRDYPLNFHPAAVPAAMAAECAQDQGKYWEMHDKIFKEQQKQGQGTVQFTAQDLKTWAGQIGLNTATFNQCLDSEKYKAEVEKDTADGSAVGVNGTPAFFIGKSTQSGTIDGTFVSGAQPFAAFKTIIDQMLQ